MCDWCGNASSFAAGWWWVIPIAAMALCILICFFTRFRFTGWRCCLPSGARRDDWTEIKKEIGWLKEEIKRIKEKG